MALAGLIMVEIYMIETELINSDLTNLLVGIYHELSWFLMSFIELIRNGQFGRFGCPWSRSIGSRPVL